MERCNEFCTETQAPVWCVKRWLSATGPSGSGFRGDCSLMASEH